MKVGTDKAFKRKGILRVIPLLLTIFALGSCNSTTTPKPKGYPRITLPEDRAFKRMDKDCPYSFEYPENAILTDKGVLTKSRNRSNCWFNLVYPRYKAQIHLTYKDLEGEGNLRRFLKESHKMAYEHQVKARNIIPKTISHDSSKVFGTKYRITGNVASNVQFYVTDSSDHFLRGSLYFMTSPNPDSLEPVIDYIDKDIDRLLRTLKWKSGPPTSSGSSS